jgi:hypothetical protein
MTQNVGANDEAVNEKIFFGHFPYSERDTTILRGTLVENVKKSKINLGLGIFRDSESVY